MEVYERKYADAGRLELNNNGSGKFLIDQLLEDDLTANSYLKGLINISEFAAEWKSVRNRLSELEKTMMEMSSTTNREVLQRDFVLMEEYTLTVSEAYAARFEDHSARVKALEADTIKTWDGFREQNQSLERLHSRIGSQELLLHETLDDITRNKSEADLRHNEITKALDAAERESNAREVVAQRLFKEAEIRQSETNSGLLSLERRMKATEDFLKSDKFSVHIRTTCAEVLKAYISFSEVDEVVAKVSERLISPIAIQVSHLQTELADTQQEARLGKEQLAASAKGVVDEVQICRLEQQKIWDALEDRQPIATAHAMEERLQEAMSSITTDSVNLRTATTAKLWEVIDRVAEFQEMLGDHEHALQHQQEEILNRATKYDLTIVEHRLDACASKEKVDAELKDLQQTTRWTQQKLEEITHAQHFMQASSTLRRATSGEIAENRSNAPELDEISQGDNEDAISLSSYASFTSRRSQVSGVSNNRSPTPGRGVRASIAKFSLKVRPPPFQSSVRSTESGRASLPQTRLKPPRPAVKGTDLQIETPRLTIDNLRAVDQQRQQQCNEEKSCVPSPDSPINRRISHMLELTVRVAEFEFFTQMLEQLAACSLCAVWTTFNCFQDLSCNNAKTNENKASVVNHLRILLRAIQSKKVSESLDETWLQTFSSHCLSETWETHAKSGSNTPRDNAQTVSIDTALDSFKAAICHLDDLGDVETNESEPQSLTNLDVVTPTGHRASTEESKHQVSLEFPSMPSHDTVTTEVIFDEPETTRARPRLSTPSALKAPAKSAPKRRPLQSFEKNFQEVSGPELFVGGARRPCINSSNRRPFVNRPLSQAKRRSTGRQSADEEDRPNSPIGPTSPFGSGLSIAPTSPFGSGLPPL